MPWSVLQATSGRGRCIENTLLNDGGQNSPESSHGVDADDGEDEKALRYLSASVSSSQVNPEGLEKLQGVERV